MTEGWELSAGPVRTYYRSLDAAGDLWCESRDPDEVLRTRRPGEAYSLQRIEVYETTQGWLPWFPEGAP